MELLIIVINVKLYLIRGIAYCISFVNQYFSYVMIMQLVFHISCKL